MKICKKCKKEKLSATFSRHNKNLCLKCNTMKTYYVSTALAKRESLGLECLRTNKRIKVVTKYLHPTIYLSPQRVLKMAEHVDMIIVSEEEVYLKGFFNREKEDILTRMNVLERDNYKCTYCGEAGKTMDHIIPMSKGGEFIVDNLVTACERCNFVKDSAIISTEHMKEFVSKYDYLDNKKLKRKIKKFATGIEINIKEEVTL